jgi:diketogulonate reductase-like aldo/keto reductase
MVNPIIGLNSQERIGQAVEVVKFQLTDDEVKYLEKPYLSRNIQGTFTGDSQIGKCKVDDIMYNIP